jgi:hypothetical protein
MSKAELHMKDTHNDIYDLIFEVMQELNTR